MDRPRTRSGTRSTCEGVLRTRGFDPALFMIAMTQPSNKAVLSPANSGAGMAVLSHLVLASALAAGDLVELPLGPPDRRSHALRHKERYRTRAADALTDSTLSRLRDRRPRSVARGFRPPATLDHPRKVIR